MVYFERTARLWSDIAVDAAALPGDYSVGGTLEFMVCNDRICYPPTTTTFEAALQVAATVLPDSSASGVALDGAASVPPGRRALDFEGFWAFLLLAIGAGFGAFLMPCVYPMIPLTVSYFTRHSERLSEAVRMALVYGIAIVLTFTGLGTAMAALVQGAGVQQLAANPWMNLFIGTVFVVFAAVAAGPF